ncbi:hypothetical protein B0J14DRAFT_633208 [Halenospora varia]|nr:hypothetical protein B0J14DRAFT_633208 [Halenospora varia]
MQNQTMNSSPPSFPSQDLDQPPPPSLEISDSQPSRSLHPASSGSLSSSQVPPLPPMNTHTPQSPPPRRIIITSSPFPSQDLDHPPPPPEIPDSQPPNIPHLSSQSQTSSQSSSQCTDLQAAFSTAKISLDNLSSCTKAKYPSRREQVEALRTEVVGLGRFIELKLEEMRGRYWNHVAAHWPPTSNNIPGGEELAEIYNGIKLCEEKMTEGEKRRDVVGYDELGELISGDEDEKRNKGLPRYTTKQQFLSEHVEHNMDPGHPQAPTIDESSAETSTVTQHTDASRVSRSDLASILSKAQEHQLKMAFEKVKQSLGKFSSATRLVALGRFIDDEAEKAKNEKNPIALKNRYWDHVVLHWPLTSKAEPLTSQELSTLYSKIEVFEQNVSVKANLDIDIGFGDLEGMLFDDEDGKADEDKHEDKKLKRGG